MSRPVIVHLRRDAAKTHCGRDYRKPDGSLRLAVAEPDPNGDYHCGDAEIRACRWCVQTYESDQRRP